MKVTALLSSVTVTVSLYDMEVTVLLSGVTVTVL